MRLNVKVNAELQKVTMSMFCPSITHFWKARVFARQSCFPNLELIALVTSTPFSSCRPLHL
jgi:hypothetical protein